MVALLSAVLRSRRSSTSSLPVASRRSFMADLISLTRSSDSFDLYSSSDFSVECRRLSASFLACARSLRRLSSAACISASFTIWLIWSSLRPPDDWMAMLCSLPVALSRALTCTMPLASMSKVTSILGTPRGAGGMPTRSNWPRSLFMAAMSRSPWSTLMPTWVWLSAAVENSWLFLVGMVVLRGMRRVKMPPRVSMPSERGVTSRRSTSLTLPLSTPPWMAAPMATTSSGFTPLDGSRLKSSLTTSTTRGIRVMPPTRRTSLMSLVLRPASLSALRQGSLVLSMRLSTSFSSWTRVILMLRCLGPEASAVRKGRLTSVVGADDSSHLAFSAASRRRWITRRSLDTSMPDDFLNSAMRWARMLWSKSSPPKWVSPLVDLTSNTPAFISRMDTSKVPPPRSYTAMVLPSSRLSRP
mmetsp:Transcript_2961/g.8290  ORF Transcript_2961/g.8290 Transcript_2961/m.8290 type:complete len:414 (-) Transcript_2961:748-1989(-)